VTGAEVLRASVLICRFDFADKPQKARRSNERRAAITFAVLGLAPLIRLAYGRMPHTLDQRMRCAKLLGSRDCRTLGGKNRTRSLRIRPPYREVAFWPLLDKQLFLTHWNYS
jgi:hypothetical protein